MASAIDPTKPVDGVPASKADLRTNLQAAKDEIGALQANLGVNILDHGGVGDDATDNTAAFNAAQAEAVAAGHHTVYFPPGWYRGDFVPHRQVSLRGEPQETGLCAFTAGGYAVDYDVHPTQPAMDLIWQRPFIRDIGIHGFNGTRNGLRIWNAYGVDLDNVAINRCDVGLWTADNYYGLWNNIKITECDIGLYASWAPDDGRHNPSGHTANKTLIEPTIRLNRVGVLIESRLSRIIGGTIEGNWACGLATDPLAGISAGWESPSGLVLESVWFEANGLFAGDDPLILSDATEVPGVGLYVADGTAVHLDRMTTSYVHVAAGGYLYAIKSVVGVGPVDAVLTVEAGATFKHALGLVPESFNTAAHILYDGDPTPIDVGAKAYTSADKGGEFRLTGGTQTFGAASGFSSDFAVNLFRETAGSITIDGVDADYTISGPDAVTVKKVGTALLAVGKAGVVILDAA